MKSFFFINIRTKIKIKKYKILFYLKHILLYNLKKKIYIYIT